MTKSIHFAALNRRNAAALTEYNKYAKTINLGVYHLLNFEHLPSFICSLQKFNLAISSSSSVENK